MKMVLITGASGAIGRATARKLADAGFSLYLHYYSNKSRIAALAEDLAAAYPKQTFISLQANLAEEDGPGGLLRQMSFPVEGVIYACGKSQIGLFQDTDLPIVRQLIQLQLISPFQLIQELIRPMIRAKKGKLVLVSSIWGLTGASTEVLYSMVKGGQNTFVKALAKEVAPSGISVNAVAPGAVDTPMMDRFSREDIELVKEDIPMNRLARPEEVAALIHFLMRPEADYINGQVISVNGAWYC